MVYEINITVLIYYREQQRLPLFKERQMHCGHLLPLDHSPIKKQEGRGAAGLGTLSPGVREDQELVAEAGCPGVMSLSQVFLSENPGWGQEKERTPGPFRARS